MCINGRIWINLQPAFGCRCSIFSIFCNKESFDSVPCLLGLLRGVCESRIGVLTVLKSGWHVSVHKHMWGYSLITNSSFYIFACVPVHKLKTASYNWAAFFYSDLFLFEDLMVLCPQNDKLKMWRNVTNKKRLLDSPASDLGILRAQKDF